MRPCPCVLRILGHRLVLGDWQKMQADSLRYRHYYMCNASSSCTFRASVPAFRRVARNNLVTNLDRCHTRANGLHNSASLMPEDAREFSFGVLTRECIDIRMAQSIRKNLETDFSCLGRRDCDGFRLQRLVGGPGLPAPRLQRDKSLNMQKSRTRTYHGCLTLNRLRLRT
jgi:hypothetical protein